MEEQVVGSLPDASRLSERRGIQKLAHIETPVIVNSMRRAFQTQKPTRLSRSETESILVSSNSSSSLASSIGKSPTGVPRLQSSSVATTPVDVLPLTHLDTPSSLPITPEIEEFQGNWRQLDDGVVATYSGLGLDCEILEDLKHRARSMSLSERVHIGVNKGSSPSASAIFEQPEAPFGRDDLKTIPAPRDHSEGDISSRPGSGTTSSRRQSTELYDPDTLTDHSIPTSPVLESVGKASRRTAAVLQRILPQKLRGHRKRRSSNTPSNLNQLISPLASTNSSFYKSAPETPDEDFETYFSERLPLPDNESFSSIEETAQSCVPTPPLPPFMMHNYFAKASNFHSTLSTAGTIAPVAGDPSAMDHVPEIPSSLVNEAIKSPLPEPPISPFGSPGLPAVRASLNIITPISLSSYQHQQVVPDVIESDSPTILLPRHQRQPSMPSCVTADSLADMIERMQREDVAFEVTEQHLTQSGWNTPEEVEAIRRQRREARIEWQARIEETKRALISIKKQQAQQKSRDQILA